ncbi:unnamed protein product [Darwinula stevensoni]|uniref:Methionine adenosyltransferase 2 subunit beta n=1 Tax=Darwinula stevensoni TaxID=69355 RepID=A0A7R9A944_9CRUS|nr:unnamed protein product [Darwinula stevensoni]CAG0897039.1 unnamed protein product [Darwinula stevensoni]
MKLDITDFEATGKYLRDLHPSLIVHCAAQRSPDKVDTEYEKTCCLNVEASGNLASLAKEVGAKMIYISTDYVFDGKNPPYHEGDKTNPLNKYGLTKLQGEEAVMKSYPDAIILRIGILYGEVEHLEESAVTTLFSTLKDKNHEKTVSDYEIRYPTHINDIAHILVGLAEKCDSSGEVKGIYHWCGKEAMTKFKMVQEMSNALSIPMDHVKPDSSPQSGAVTRPYNAQLATSRIDKLGLGCHTPFKVGITECLKPYL